MVSKRLTVFGMKPIVGDLAMKNDSENTGGFHLRLKVCKDPANKQVQIHILYLTKRYGYEFVFVIHKIFHNYQVAVP